MAITLIVEDGSGLPNANSYLSIEEADEFLSVDFHKSQAWVEFDDDTKALLIANATRYLDDNYQFYGKRATKTQALEWPRHGARDCDQDCISSAIVPKEVKRAAAYLAVWLHGNDGESALNNGGVKRFRSDDIEIEWQDGATVNKGPAFLSKLLICLGLGPNDRGFKPIIRK